MSEIIDDGFINYNKNSFQTGNQVTKSIDQNNIQSHHYKQDIVKLLTKFFNYFNSQYYLQSFTETPKQYITLKILFYDSSLKSLCMMVNLVFNLKQSFIELFANLIQDQKPYKIQTLDQRILLCKLFSKSYINQQNKLKVNLNCGQFSILRPKILSYQESFNDILQHKNKSQSLHNIIKATVADAVSVFKLLLRQITPQLSSQTRSKSQNDLLNNIIRYTVRSPIQPAFQISFGSGKYDKMQILLKFQNHVIQSTIKNIQMDYKQFQTHLLYTNPDYPLKSLKELYKKQYFQSNQQQINFLKQKTQPPSAPIRLNSSFQSKYVYNIIQINENSDINLKKINNGGFSQISKTQVQFWYMLTVSNQKMQKIQKVKKNTQQQAQQQSSIIHQQQSQITTQHKVKKQTRKNLVFKSNSYKGFESGRNRILHQLKIVSRFKGVSSIFLPQYFKINNEKSPFSQYLIMQFLSYPTLSEYFQDNKISMSFLTKIYLASLIMQGLRCLKNYQIVHMDLKPSNIIVSKRLVVKLIDFGQSYNKQICQKSFKPAFSMPYGSPQIFDGVGKQFNQKNDVYSWAVILFQLLFKRLPFFFSRQQANKIFKQRMYMNYLYFVPQQQTKYGSWEIMPILRNIIFKAMDKQCMNRPCSLWMTVLLKQCLTYLINLEVNNLGS